MPLNSGPRRNAPPAIVNGVSAALRRLARPVGEFNAERYFRGEHGLQFYNVGTAAMRALAKDVYQAHRDHWTVGDAITLADALMRDPHLETKSVGIEVVARFRKTFTPALLPRWKRWLAQNLSANWATTDAICGSLTGPLLSDYAELVPEMRTWVRHPNLWVRRASMVSLIVPMRRGLGVDLAYENARILHRDPHDLIQKAVGWTLREAGKRDSAKLEEYLKSNGPSIPRTTLRYAIERFPPAARTRLLRETRSTDGVKR
jgi:3-methyladenine DNA glycosylase AlkD